MSISRNAQTTAGNQEPEHFPDLLSFVPAGHAAITAARADGVSKLLRKKKNEGSKSHSARLRLGPSPSQPHVAKRLVSLQPQQETKQ